MDASRIQLRYSPADYRYQKIILVPQAEKCSITHSTVKELCDEKISQGVPHFLALVRDEDKGTIYHAAALCEIFAADKRWEWKNPETNIKIKSIDFFAMTVFKDGYALFKKIKLKQDNPQAYEDLWFCSTLAFASESDNPHAFYSIASVIKHYNKNNQNKESLRWRKSLFVSIEKHFGRGIALIVVAEIVSLSLPFLKEILFQGLNYSSLNHLLKGSELDKWITANKDNLFDVDKSQQHYILIKKMFFDILKANQNHPGAKFAEFLFNANEKGSYTSSEFEVFASSTQIDIAHLAQATLCMEMNPKFLDKYIVSLTQFYPEWKAGSAMLLSHRMTDVEQARKLLPKFVELSRGSKDVLILELVAEKFENYNFKSDVWLSAQHIYMKLLTIGRNLDSDFAFKYASKIHADGESKNSLAILQSNYDFFQTFVTLEELSQLQREIGVKTRDQKLYQEGVRNGLVVFNNRAKHNRLSFPLAGDLTAEITPFKATREEENKGLEVLLIDQKRAENNHVIKLLLANYFIRKGTTSQAKQGVQWSEDLINKYPLDAKLPLNLMRWKLRSAESKDDLLLVETMVSEFERFHNNINKDFYLIKALLQSHPLRTKGMPEWFLLASSNFKKAFEEADTREVKFLLDNLSRYDKLTEDDQIKCRTMIAELLGLG